MSSFSSELDRVASAAIPVIQHGGNHHHIEVDTATVTCKDCGARFLVVEQSAEHVTFRQTGAGDGSCAAEAERIAKARSKG